jgi:protein-S-isoprenylcysteine O-methyltransferase Ste14
MTMSPQQEASTPRPDSERSVPVSGPSLAAVDQVSAAKRGARRWLLREIFGCVMVAALLFIAAGRLDWVMGWALVALYVVWVAANAILLMPSSPALLAERVTHRFSEKRWDNVILGLYGAMTLVKLIVAGLDFRFGWTPPLPPAVPFSALVVAALGYALVTWAMVANAYFALANRIQAERSHTVATSGPYRFVRHPGYTGAILFELATPILLGSAWALIPGAVSALALVVRTLLEDRSLHTELAGYADYAGRVRYRLLPGVW